MTPFGEHELGVVYRAVSVARQLGSFGGPHGPLEVTAWLHVVASDLERLDDAIDAVPDGHALAVLRDASRDEPPLHLLPRRPRLDAKLLRLATIGIRDPEALAAAMRTLRRRGPDGLSEAEGLLWYAARRTAAVNLAIEAAQRYLAGWWTARRLRTRLANLSPLAVEGAGDQHDHDHHDEPEAPTSDHSDGCACLDHERLTSALVRHWLALDERVTHEGTEPAETARPQARPSPSAIEGPPPRLRLTPCAEPLSVGQPAHIWVDLGTAPPGESHGEVRVTGPVEAQLAVSLREHETLVSLPPAAEPGQLTVEATMTVAGHPVEAEPITLDVVAERPPCATHVGGAWELAQVEAHEQVDACVPARILDQVASRARGLAGALLTGAYNALVVGTQLCVKNADTTVCAEEREEKIERCTKERDDGYNRCTAERDDGYNRCTAERDDGYNKCCDWWPCSWFCRAWVWVSNIVCVAWTWVSNVVCVAWQWVSHILCVAWEWLKNIVCVAWVVISTVACVLGAVVLGLIKLGGGLVVLGAALGLAGLARLMRGPCRLLGMTGTVEEVSSSLKVVAVHAALLRTGEVLLMSYDEGVYPVDGQHPADFSAVADSDRALCAVWDPTTGRATYSSDLRRNVFCSHHAFLNDGRMFVASGQFPLPFLLKSLLPPRLLAPGADADVHVYDPAARTWTRRPNMKLGRWYPTCVTLADGRVFVASGTNGYATNPGFGRGIQDTWEIADPSGLAGSPVATNFFWYHLYPFAHLLPTGQVFTHSKRSTRIFDPDTGTWTRVAPRRALAAAAGDTVWPYSRTGPGPGTSVLLPLRPVQEEDRWVYPTGRVMILGGGGAEAAPEPPIPDETYELRPDTPATRTVEILDLDDRDPAWRWAGNPMANGRVMPDTVLLPDGTVLVVGGGRFGKSGGLLAHFASVEREGGPATGATDPVLEPELFDPETETWRTLCPKPIGRLYHTTVLLLADGRVLVGGHDGALNMPPYDESQYDLEIFSPPYLFAPDGSPAPRPVINAAPEGITYDEDFEVAVNGEITDIALIRPTSVTHQINTDQRYVGLPFALEDDDDAGVIRVTAPPNAAVAPAGWYLLFVVDSVGTPSVGTWTRLQAARSP